VVDTAKRFLVSLALALVPLGATGCALFSQDTPAAKVKPQVLAAPEEVEEAEDSTSAGLAPVKPFGDSDSPSAQTFFEKPRQTHVLDPSAGVPADIERLLPRDVSAQVEDYLHYFTGPARDHFATWLSRSTRYVPLMRRIFRENNVPPDLVYLAMVESGFSPRAYSPARAAGQWQFIASTGRRYNLRISSYVDERRDPEKSTRAAARYLRDLYEMFNSWDLALASYNAGEAKIDRGVRRYATENFWEISKTSFLAKETREYVPQYLAALMIARNPAKYGFADVVYQEPLRYETVSVGALVSLRSIARVCGTTSEALKALNPALTRGVTPPGGTYEVRVPVGSARLVEANLTRLASVGAPNHRTRYRVHRVRRGQTLASVARRYGVTPTVLARANGMSTKAPLRAGVRLRIPTTDGIERVSDAPGAARPHGKARGAGSVGRGASVVYVVKQGDTLQAISAKFHTTVKDLMRHNKLRRSRIKVGRRLVIPTRSTGPVATSGGEA
jgi:membrane-bound lytic murein transglycosylase D